MTAIDNQLLIVEDDPQERALIEYVLTMLGMRQAATFVHDGADAMDYLKCTGSFAERNPDERPRAMLLDLNMPRLDGFEVIREVRADPRLAATVIVVFSSSEEQADIAAAYMLGANSFLVKPVQGQNFAEVLKKAIEYWVLLNRNPE